MPFRAGEGGQAHSPGLHGSAGLRHQVAAACCALLGLVLSFNPSYIAAATDDSRFEGKHYRGRGDVEYLRLLETARRMFEPDPELQNLSMLYMPSWNGLVEGPTWDAWWIQNSYGTTYAILPLLREPFVTFLQNAQDLWFDQMGDGKRVGADPAVRLGGAGRLPVRRGAAGLDRLQAGRRAHRDPRLGHGIHRRGRGLAVGVAADQPGLPRPSRITCPCWSAAPNFIETRRDPTNNLFLAGPAGNLLAPSYAGWKRPDGTYDKAYLAGLSVTYIAALDRLIELEKLAGRTEQAALYTQRRDLARRGLPLLTTDEGYFIRSLDPDGVKHGVFGAEQHGYFEASPEPRRHRLPRGR